MKFPKKDILYFHKWRMFTGLGHLKNSSNLQDDESEVLIYQLIQIDSIPMKDIYNQTMVEREMKLLEKISEQDKKDYEMYQKLKYRYEYSAKKSWPR